MPFHVNPHSGNPGECKAIYACPFGGDDAHYSSPEEAREAYESKMASEMFGGAVQSKPGFFDTVDPDLAKEISSGSFEFQNFAFEHDWNNYDSTVWRGEETSTEG